LGVLPFTKTNFMCRLPNENQNTDTGACAGFIVFGR
jgi:hypothetical protein